MSRAFDRKIILEDGDVYYGYGFGSDAETVCEVVFNTSMTGYPEILSGPSYTDQAGVMTYPLIGNYGMQAEDYESDGLKPAALIVREYCEAPSGLRCERPLDQALAEAGVAGVQGVDTRRLTRSIRDEGSRRALITSADTPLEEGLIRLRETELPHDAVARAGCKAPYTVECAHAKYRIAAIDCGMKRNILRSFAQRGIETTVLPWNTPVEEILALAPDGLFLSNGPGDPTDVPETIRTVKTLIGRLPVFGICLGHQVISLACGGETYKLKFGHRGGNHPVRELATGKIAMTSQNHSYAVRGESLAETCLYVTHVNVLDGTVEGAASEAARVFSVQFHPESAPGPQDSLDLFERFIHLMEACRHA